MQTPELQGTTLGEKHRNYNKLVIDAVKTNQQFSTKDFKPDDNDITNLIKIDVAGKNKDLEYILKILQCEDMLYVSRAIKQSSWLIADRQYSHIVNPNYLHNELFPNMVTTACSKLLLHIRLNLKDEDRVEEFYNYFKERDIDVAVRWLPYCSITHIQKEVEQHYKAINIGLLKRLCERSFNILKTYMEKCDYYNKREKLEKTIFLLNSDTEKYLDIIEPLEDYQKPNFGPRATSLLMKKCHQRILSNFDKYANKIDLPTFAKYLKQEKLKDFLTKMRDKKEMNRWFTFENLKHFVRFLPKEGRFEFIKKIFIEKIKDEGEDTAMYDSESFCMAQCSSKMGDCFKNPRSSANIYRWYRFAPFEVAFPDLIKLIRAESVPEERVAIFGVLLHCAGRNPQHLQTLLQYYSEKHTNEPFRFKIQFVNKFLSKTDSFKLDKTNWNLLNNLFHSMEVYIASNNNVQTCVEAIIVYNLLHKENITEMIEGKFQFNSMKAIQKKLNDEEKELVFNYLFEFIVKKIKSKTITSETDFNDIVELLEDVQRLMTDWEKNIVEYPWLLEKIREIITIRSKNAWKTSLSNLYLKNKSWRRAMFEESLIMHPSDEACYNSLKHDPQLIVRHKNLVEQMLRDDSLSLNRMLKTLRIYWLQSIASEWVALYLASLNQPNGHKAIIRGFCTLASQKQVIEILKKYAPTESKINWSDYDELVLSFRKNIARYMYLSRPPPAADIILMYAKGDYLQFALPSLNSVLHKMSAAKTREHVSKLLDAPVSLQKHGIRNAFVKLEPVELKKLFNDIWQKAKNPTIRAVLFKQTHCLLCKQKKPAIIEEIYELLSLFIDNLTTDENKDIYVTLCNIDKVPTLVQGKLFMKSYRFLKSLPPKANMENSVHSLMCKMTDLIEHLDPEFVEEVLHDTEAQLTKQFCYTETELMAAYMLCAKDVDSQTGKYKKVLLPFLQRTFDLWDTKFDNMYFAGINFVMFLKSLFKYVPKFVFEKSMIFPTKLFSDLLTELETKPTERHYEMQTTWKLITTFVKILEELKDELVAIKAAQGDAQQSEDDMRSNNRWNDYYLKAMPKFADLSLQYLREDVKKYFPSIYFIFAKCLDHTLKDFHEDICFEFLKLMLKDEEFIPSYLVVVNNTTTYYDKDKRVIDIRRKLFMNPSVEVKLHYYRRFGRHVEAEQE